MWVPGARRVITAPPNLPQVAEPATRCPYTIGGGDAFRTGAGRGVAAGALTGGFFARLVVEAGVAFGPGVALGAGAAFARAVTAGRDAATGRALAAGAGAAVECGAGVGMAGDRIVAVSIDANLGRRSREADRGPVLAVPPVAVPAGSRCAIGGGEAATAAIAPRAAIEPPVVSAAPVEPVVVVEAAPAVDPAAMPVERTAMASKPTTTHAGPVRMLLARMRAARTRAARRERTARSATRCAWRTGSSPRARRRRGS